VQGSWNGKTMTGASPGTSSQLSWAAFGEGLLGYAGSVTDTGQHNIDSNWIINQTGPLAHTLNLGTQTDWAYRATQLGHEWTLKLVQTYYGMAPTKNYWNGCSGAGWQGMGQLQHYGDQYDGFLIGAPAYYWEQFWLSDSWPIVVWKKVRQKGGTIPTQAQLNALNTSVVAACDVEGSDTVKDGIISDPRACKFDAKVNICGAPGAPTSNCLTLLQAEGFNAIWDGPHNHFGKRIWWSIDRGISSIKLTDTWATGGGPDSYVIQWAEKDLNFDPNNVYADQESLAGNPPEGIIYEDIAALVSNVLGQNMNNAYADLEKAVRHGTKVIQLHGMADPLIRMRQDIDYYRRVATWYGGFGDADFASVQRWYRFFTEPNIGHCSGGTGPWAMDPFLALVNWVEHGIPPQSLLAAQPTSPPSASYARTRLLCPFPQTAIYNGTGNTDVASSWHCGGNLETHDAVCDDLRTKFGRENKNDLAIREVGAEHEYCVSGTADSDHEK
jgi:hypothetical protein